MNLYTVLVTCQTAANSQEEAYRTIRTALDAAKLAEVVTVDQEVTEVAVENEDDEEDEREDRQMDAFDEAYEHAAANYDGSGKDWR